MSLPKAWQPAALSAGASAANTATCSWLVVGAGGPSEPLRVEVVAGPLIHLAVDKFVFGGRGVFESQVLGLGHHHATLT